MDGMPVVHLLDSSWVCEVRSYPSLAKARQTVSQGPARKTVPPDKIDIMVEAHLLTHTWMECPYCIYSIPVWFAKCARNHPSPELVKQCHRDPPARRYRVTRLISWLKRTCRAIHGWNARTAFTRFQFGLRSALVTSSRQSSSNSVAGTRPRDGTA